MKHFKKELVPEHEKEVLDKVTCDICKKKILDPEVYEIDETEVFRRTGVNYPEGGSGEEISIDMCGDCFDNKFIPWLKSVGANPISEDWSQ